MERSGLAGKAIRASSDVFERNECDAVNKLISCVVPPTLYAVFALWPDEGKPAMPATFS